MDFNWNQDVIRGKWKQFKGNLQKNWGKITDDQWEQTKGEAKSISGLIQEKYGMSREEADKKLSAAYGDFLESVDETRSRVKEQITKNPSSHN
ncbi:MAG: CsbD family protein [Bdellovibrionales bacterium]